MRTSRSERFFHRLWLWVDLIVRTRVVASPVCQLRWHALLRSRDIARMHVEVATTAGAFKYAVQSAI